MAVMEEATLAHNVKQEIATSRGYSPAQQLSIGKNNDSGVGGGEKRWPGWPGENVFRLLVPVQKVGGIIGRKGELIKKTCEETGARIKILEAPPGTPDRVVMISAKEEPDALMPPAIDGLLRVHRRTIDGLDVDPAHGPPSPGFTVSSRLLMVASQAGYLIGKQGATIKSIQEASNAIVRVLGLEELPVSALQDDRVVEIQGEPSAVQRAIKLIVSHLRKFLVDRSVLGLMEKHMQMPSSQVEQNVPLPLPHQSWGPQNFPPNAGGGPGFGTNLRCMPPARQHDDYSPLPDCPPVNKQPLQGLSMYERDAPSGVHSSTNVQQPPPKITKVTQYLQVSLSYADAVIGSSGTNISYARRASGATITIQETRGVPGEMTVEINGSAAEVQTAQQLIQNFMAEGAAASQNPVGGYAVSSYDSSRIGQTIGGGYAASSYDSSRIGQNIGGGSAASSYDSSRIGPNIGGHGSVFEANYGY